MTHWLYILLDENQPREQAGFRSEFSTSDHLHALNQAIEKANEYNLKLCVGYIDYEKAFDSVEHKDLFTALRIYVRVTYNYWKIYVTQRELMRLFEGDIKTDILNSTYCSISKKHFDTKTIFITYSYEKL